MIHETSVRLNRDGVLGRRDFLRSTAAGVAATGLGLTGALRSSAAELKEQGMHCILLFMQGGPSQFETFDPKPGTDTGGPTEAIDTSVGGIKVASHWPNVAKQMDDIALIRSLTGREGNHIRAQYLLHTGYAPSGSVKYPNFGSVAANELGDANFDLPRFVAVAGPTATGAGFLDASVAPYLVGDPNQMPLNSTLPAGVDENDLKRRLKLMSKVEGEFAKTGAEPLVDMHQAINKTAARMATSPRLKAFDLSQEKDSLRDKYGRTPFGQGCLLARRLVETGVTFVEVVSRNWDTHRDNFNESERLSGIVDPGFATLVADLKDRGLLEKTLVVWMGEFGRTPRINGRTGRDHYPRASNIALAGGGVKGGQVIGATDEKGYAVTDRPVTVPDLFCTFCAGLGISPRKRNYADTRPIRIVEGGEPVKEVFG